MYATLVDSTTAFSPSRHPLGQANGSGTVSLTMPTLTRVSVPRKRSEETNTVMLDPPRDAVGERSREADEKLAQHKQAMREVHFRIIELRSDAELSDELHAIDSACNLAMFLDWLGITKRPSIFLLDNGNFQAVWRNDSTKEQVSLQFFGHKVVQYAMFALQNGTMKRIADRGDMAAVRTLLKTHGCSHLIV
jgi:hypothetical protein